MRLTLTEIEFAIYKRRKQLQAEMFEVETEIAKLKREDESLAMAEFVEAYSS